MDRVREDYMIYVAKAEHWRNERGPKDLAARSYAKTADKLARELRARGEALPTLEENPYRW